MLWLIYEAHYAMWMPQTPSKKWQLWLFYFLLLYFTPFVLILSTPAVVSVPLRRLRGADVWWRCQEQWRRDRRWCNRVQFQPSFLLSTTGCLRRLFVFTTCFGINLNVSPFSEKERCFFLNLVYFSWLSMYNWKLCFNCGFLISIQSLRDFDGAVFWPSFDELYLFV